MGLGALGDLLGFHGLPVEVARNLHKRKCEGHGIVDCPFVEEIRENLRSGADLSETFITALAEIRA